MPEVEERLVEVSVSTSTCSSGVHSARPRGRSSPGIWISRTPRNPHSSTLAAFAAGNPRSLRGASPVAVCLALASCGGAPSRNSKNQLGDSGLLSRGRRAGRRRFASHRRGAAWSSEIVDTERFRGAGRIIGLGGRRRLRAARRRQVDALLLGAKPLPRRGRRRILVSCADVDALGRRLTGMPSLFARCWATPFACAPRWHAISRTRSNCPPNFAMYRLVSVIAMRWFR